MPPCGCANRGEGEGDPNGVECGAGVEWDLYAVVVVVVVAVVVVVGGRVRGGEYYVGVVGARMVGANAYYVNGSVNWNGSARAYAGV